MLVATNKLRMHRTTQTKISKKEKEIQTETIKEPEILDDHTENSTNIRST